MICSLSVWLVTAPLALAWTMTSVHSPKPPIINVHMQSGHPGHSKPRQNSKRKYINDIQKQSNGERTVVILYHKPSNVITSHSNNDEAPNSVSERRRTVYEDIYSMNGLIPTGSTEGQIHQITHKNSRDFQQATGIRSKLHAIGRLDADTTGLLLLTNDGNLVHRITNPTSKDASNFDQKPIQKTYEAIIMGYHTLPSNQLSVLLTEGVALPQKHGGQTKPVDNLTILSHPSRTTTCVSITISEGKNRQIRRMFHAVGSGVMKLHRVSVGEVTLGNLKEGEWRLLSEDEVLRDLGYKCRYLDSDIRKERDRDLNRKRR
jgi:pseudouridine synthase